MTFLSLFNQTSCFFTYPFIQSFPLKPMQKYKPFQPVSTSATSEVDSDGVVISFFVIIVSTELLSRGFGVSSPGKRNFILQIGASFKPWSVVILLCINST